MPVYLSSSTGLGKRATAELAEDLVHNLRSAGQRGDYLVPIDQLGRRGLVVPGQQRDRLDGHAVRGQPRHEGVPQLRRHPRGAQPGGLGDLAELHSHTVIVLQRAHRRSEHNVVLLPQRPSVEPGLRLAIQLLP